MQNCNDNTLYNNYVLNTFKTRWATYKIAYHIILVPKYRRRILQGDVQKEFKHLILDCCQRHGMVLLAVETDEDHAHLFVSAPPRMSPSSIVNLVKGYTSIWLRRKFEKLKKTCGEDALWSKTYYVGTAGSVAAETIMKYIYRSKGQ